MAQSPLQSPDKVLALADRLHSAAVRLLRAVRTGDVATGLSAPRLSALSVLAFAGPQSLSALAKIEQVSAPTMSKLVAELETAGLALKRADRADRRGVRIEITARGRALLEKGRQQRLALLRGRLARLSRAEQDKLAAAAELMLSLSQSD